MHRPAWPLLLALLLLSACGEEPSPVATYDADGRLVGAKAVLPVQPMNIVVILVDTLRADAVAIGDEQGGRMPFLSTLAQKGVACSNCAAPAPWTLPSIASMLTGRLPWTHGCDTLNDPTLLPSIPTYAEALSNTYGYDCTAFVDGPWFREGSSLLQGFSMGGQQMGLTRLPIGLERWRERRDPEQPFFLFIHTFDAHDPYGPLPRGPDPEAGAKYETFPPDWVVTRDFMAHARRRERLFAQFGDDVVDAVFRYTYRYGEAPQPEMAQELHDAYFDGAAWVDGLLETTVGILEREGLLENTLFVVTSDHGETFGEHGMLGHGRQLHDELVRVPLILWGGDFDGGRVLDASVGLLDVLATFFESQGFVPLPDARGASLRPLLASKDGGRPILSQERIDSSHAPVEAPIHVGSVRDRWFKYILRFGPAADVFEERVYDLQLDPGETRPLRQPWSVGPAFRDAVDSIREQVLDQAGTPGKDLPFGAFAR